MKIKTADLTGAALDWAVAKCEGERYGPPTFHVHQNSKGATVYLNAGMQQFGIPYRPSADWAQGGPIIEREELQVHVANAVDGKWCAKPSDSEYWDFDGAAYGPTPLIAAMRCFVTKALGDEVDVPEELCTP